MNFLSAFADPTHARTLSERINRAVTRPWSIMEICGGQTHAIMRYGIKELLPPSLQLIHGPGCPVCVTPTEKIDRAIDLAGRPNLTLCTFGDMIRVPGSLTTLAQMKAAGADVRIVYSPIDAVDIAREQPSKDVVFFAVGFETTAPATALTIFKARELGIKNFSLLVSHVLVPPALEALLTSDDTKIDGVLAAGHVCTVMGTTEYESIVSKFRIPVIVTGFEPIDLLTGILHCIEQLESGRPSVNNQYERSVRTGGNQRAQSLIREVYQVCDLEWRGLGTISRSGLRIADSCRAYDAEARFSWDHRSGTPSEIRCQSGRILTGAMKPDACPYFRRECTPDSPLGAPMVSSEGACSAYFQYTSEASKA